MGVRWWAEGVLEIISSAMIGIIVFMVCSGALVGLGWLDANNANMVAAGLAGLPAISVRRRLSY